MRRAGWALAALLLASVLFRVPPLLNARGVHSDAATVGLQALALLRGEWSWFQWGAGYQSVFDSAVVAALFAIAGPSALALMLAPLLGHLLLTALCWDCLRRHLSAWRAAWLCLPLAFATAPVNGVALYAPRQWAITALVAAVWALDRGAGSERRARWLFAGGLLGAASPLLDLFVLQTLPALALLAALSLAAGGRPPGRWARDAGALVGGAAVIGVLFLLSRQTGAADASPASLSLDRLAHNARLLWDTCLPFLLGTEVHVPGAGLYPERWEAPLAWRAIAVAGAVLFGLGVLSAVPIGLAGAVPARVRNLGFFGVGTAACSIAGFLVSVMPQDLWSARYLAPILWTAPFALAPLGLRLNLRGQALLAPFFASQLLAGWLAYGPYVDGPRPVRAPRGVAADEAELGRVLRERGVRHALAQYWLSYRLTFLWREDPIVAPLAPGQSRYRPYLEAVSRAPVVAYIFHPSEPRADPSQVEPYLRAAGARYERLEVRGFTVLLHHR